MAGGGQPDNKNAEKWDEETAIQLGKDLISWMRAKPENIFFNDFLIVENDLYKDLIDYLCNKFESFLEYIKKAKDIQEAKLSSMGANSKLNPAVTIFLLKAKHGLNEGKAQLELSQDKENPLIDYSKLSTAALSEIIKATKSTKD